MAREYVLAFTSTLVSVDRALVQIAAGTAMPVRILSIEVSQGGSTTSTAAAAYLARLTAAQTVTAAVAGDIRKLDPGDAATSLQLGTALSGFTGTTAGTVGDVLWRSGWNILNTLPFTPIPEEMPVIPGGGIVALMWSVAPPAGTYQITLRFQEGW